MARDITDVIYELDGQTAHDVWPALLPLFTPAMRYHPYMDAIDLYHVVMNGRAQVVVLIDGGEIMGAAAMEVVTFPNLLAANIIALGGKGGFLRRYMEEFGDYLISWSRARGCHKIGFSGRPGWTRWLQGRFGMVAAPQTVYMTMPVERDLDARKH